MANAVAATATDFFGIDRDDYRSLKLDRLKVNSTLRFSLHGDEGLLLLAEGNTLTPRALAALSQRGVSRVLVHRKEPAAPVELSARGKGLELLPQRAPMRLDFYSRGSRRLDMLLSEKIAAALKNSEPPFLAELQPRGAEPYDDSLARELFDAHEQFVEEMVVTAVGNKVALQEKSQSAVEQYLSLIRKDIDLFTCMASSPDRGNYPHRHSLHTAMLSIAMGTRAGLGKNDLHSLGMGAMLHDLGMLRVAKAIWSKKGPLAVTELNELIKHPLHTLEAIERASGITDEARLICYQMHERPGGQGYPRGLPAEKIHPLSKIAAAADMYVALISERPYRPAMLPYKALEAMVKQVKDRALEPATARLLVETLSLYPVGSFVQLNDRRVAKVVRATGDTYDRPIIRVWPLRVDPADEPGEMLDLRDHPELHVTTALPAPM